MRGGASSYQAEPPFRMVPRFLLLSATNSGGATTARYRAGAVRTVEDSPDRIVLEYDETSGLFTPAWLSVRPHEARHRWRLQITPQFEHVVGLLVHRGVPLIWLTPHWDWVGRNVMRPVSPRYLGDFLKPVEIIPA